MSRRHPPEQKNTALRLLAETYGDITATHLQTGIPPRTLRAWRQEMRRQPSWLPEKVSVWQPSLAANVAAAPTAPTLFNDALSTQDDDQNFDLAAVLKTLRGQLLSHIFDLSARLNEDSEAIHLRVIALTRLLDRVVKLDALIAPHEQQQQIISFEFQYPDGSIHNHPPWEQPTDAADKPSASWFSS